jgi:hypothetical protein
VSDVDDRMPPANATTDATLPPPPPVDNDENSFMITDDFENISDFVDRESLANITAYNTTLPYADANDVNHNDSNSNESSNSSSFYAHVYNPDDVNTCNLM